MQTFQLKQRWFLVCILVGIITTAAYRNVYASDHLDTPTVIADPAADIGDIFSWTSSDGRRLNLVMDNTYFTSIVDYASARRPQPR